MVSTLCVKPLPQLPDNVNVPTASATYLFRISSLFLNFELPIFRENYADSMFPKNLMLYKTLAVLARAQDSIFGPSAWPILQLCLSVMHTASAVATIQSFRGVGELTQGLSLAVLFVLCTKLEHACFIGAAEFYQLSETFKQSITRRGRRNRMECVTARSLRSLRMNVGCFYFIKMGTFKTFMASVVDNTISVLITFFY